VDDPGEDHDIWALKHNYVSVVPSMHDLTHYAALGQLSGLEKALNGDPVSSVKN
jgi:hypothetical protein